MSQKPLFHKLNRLWLRVKQTSSYFNKHDNDSAIMKASVPLTSKVAGKHERYYAGVKHAAATDDDYDDRRQAQPGS